MSEQKSFFTTLPGILSGLAALLTAIGGLVYALNQANLIGASGEPEVAERPPQAERAAESPQATPTHPSQQATEGWAIIGKAKGLDYSDLKLMIHGDAPAIGRRYDATADFRLVAKRLDQMAPGEQVITLGMVHRGDTVEIIDLFIPTPSSKRVPVYAKLRAVLRKIGD